MYLKSFTHLKSWWKVIVTLLVVAITPAIFLNVAVADAQAEEGVPLIVFANTVRGHAGTPEKQVCVLANRFPRGQMIVWRIKVFDPKTGKTMDDEDLLYVTVELQDEQSFEAKYGGHGSPEPTDWFWTVSWVIPEDYPTGSFPYTVKTKARDGRIGEFTEFNVKPSLLTIVSKEKEEGS